MKPTAHCEATSACLPPHPAVVYLFLVSLASVYLYETHLSVANTAASQDFYTRVVGLKFAHRDLTRDIIFLWAGDDRRSMLGLWGPTTTYGRDFHRSHVAFAISASGCAAAESLARISKVSKRTSHQSSAGCRLLSSTFVTQMAILWSSSRCSTAHQIRASLDHFPSGAKRLNQPLEPTPKVFARHGGRAGRCNKTVEGGLVESVKLRGSHAPLRS
jgi:hypothetical protein